MDPMWNITTAVNSTLIQNASNEDLGKLVKNIEIGHRIFIIVLGSIGNCLSVVIFSSKHLRKLSSSCYLSALAVSDTGFLMVLFVNWLQGIGADILLEDVYCRLQTYWTYAFAFLSVWLVVAFTVERFIAVHYPLLRPSMCTVSRAKAVIAALCIISLLIFAPYMATPFEIVHLDDGSYSCFPKEISTSDLAMNYIDLVLVMVVPCIAIVSINTCICATVHRLSRRRRRMTLNGRRTIHNPHGLQQPQVSSSQNKVTRLLLVVSSVFVCLNLPSYIFRLCIYLPDAKDILETPTFWVLQRISLMMYYTNFGINFVLYCVTGQNFRASLLGLFVKNLTRQQDTTRLTVVSECGRTQRTIMINGNGSMKEVHEMLPLTRDCQ